MTANPVWHSMLYSFIHMATAAVKGLTVVFPCEFGSVWCNPYLFISSQFSMDRGTNKHRPPSTTYHILSLGLWVSWTQRPSSWDTDWTWLDEVFSGLQPWPVAVLYTITAPSLEPLATDSSEKPKTTDVTAALCDYISDSELTALSTDVRPHNTLCRMVYLMYMVLER